MWNLKRDKKAINYFFKCMGATLCVLLWELRRRHGVWHQWGWMLLGSRRLGEGELGMCCHWLLSTVLTGGKLLRREGARVAKGSGLDAAAHEGRLSVTIVSCSATTKAITGAVAASVAAVHRICTAKRFATVEAATPVVPVPETTKVPSAISVPAVIVTTAAAPWTTWTQEGRKKSQWALKEQGQNQDMEY